ncbi:MAG: cytochrome c biogenesis protein CcdA [Candidatus Thermoplasmatota archaeon]|nr:cytochrome c biogenesis protein CcdA [Candidatus Thermoplasmatota archaeon]|tara:strand:- start:993 stop:2438 length:1446 start_codon:yes stop_codon:yes gene_type:complete
MAAGLDFGVLRQKDTWQAFGIGVVLFCIIGYSSLTLFGLSASAYGVSDEVVPVPDFEVETMNRTGIDDSVADENGMVRLSDLRGHVVVIDFMAIDCANCHYVQTHIEQNLDDWKSLGGPHDVIVISIATWHWYESFDRINRTFGDLDSDKHMSWPVANSGTDVVILENGTRGDLAEYYSAFDLPIIIIVDHEGYVVAKESTGTPLDGWNSFDSAIESANAGEAEDLRFGLEKADRSLTGVFVIGLFLGILVYFSPCAFPVLPSYITYYLNLGMREDELRESGRLSGKMPKPIEVGGYAALGQLTFFGLIGAIIFGLDGIINLSGVLHDIAILIAWLLLILGSLMLLGWTSHLLNWIQGILDRYQTTETDEQFTPRRNMFLWGIGYSAASVDCTAAAVFPFVAWLAVVGDGAFVFGMAGLILSVTLLMVAVTALVGMGRQSMLDFLRRSTGIVKATGAWMMMFAGLGLLVYLTQPERVVGLL